MLIIIRHFLDKILKLCNLKIIRYDNFYNSISQKNDIKNILIKTNTNKLIKAFKIFKKSKSENFQDILVLIKSNFKKRGFFVEFGAGNGLDYSNTYLLEKEYLWNGIVCEPAKVFHDKLKKNRSCYIEKKAVWNKSRKYLNFIELKEPYYSKISKFKNFFLQKKINKIYKVETISLVDLLKKYNSPKIIDFLSIDIEGDEIKILKNFNFKTYKIKIICIEYNYNIKNLKIIDAILKKNFYRQEFKGLTFQDIFYINTKLFKYKDHN
jgi:FkbM family methyltransferase